SQFCVFPNSLPVDQGCCSDKGNVCQTGLSCTANKCSPPQAATSTPTVTPTQAPQNPTITQAPGSRNGILIVSPDPNAEEFFNPPFTSIFIQAGFVIL